MAGWLKATTPFQRRSHGGASARIIGSLLLASSSFVILAWRTLRWRARKRARIAAERALAMIKDGPMIDCADTNIKIKIMNKAICRASKWISFCNTADAKPMEGQVGGISFDKRPLLSVPPDYVLKPVRGDHRGFREVAFYEVLRLAVQGKEGNAVSPVNSVDIVKTARRDVSPKTDGSIESWDGLAMWLAISMQDEAVTESERILVSSMKMRKKEIELLRSLSRFVPSYYGVVGQELMSKGATEVSPSAHLLLSDATANFNCPCAADLKLGQQTYEQDAPEEKQSRERKKYPNQVLFGFRIVGMRFYDPSHSESDSAGYRRFDKSFGRSLKSREDVLGAFRTFFAGRVVENGAPDRPRSAREEVYEPTAIRIRVVRNLLTQLNAVRRWFEENNALAFYSSSILIVFEGNPINSPTHNLDVVNLKMIDFGHVRRQSGGDPGYLHGLKMIIRMFSDLLRKDQQN